MTFREFFSDLLMGIHPLLHFLSPPRERIRGEGHLSTESEKGGLRGIFIMNCAVFEEVITLNAVALLIPSRP
jgi:hypothetical protein